MFNKITNVLHAEVTKNDAVLQVEINSYASFIDKNSIVSFKTIELHVLFKKN